MYLGRLSRLTRKMIYRRKEGKKSLNPRLNFLIAGSPANKSVGRSSCSRCRLRRCSEEAEMTRYLGVAD